SRCLTEETDALLDERRRLAENGTLLVAERLGEDALTHEIRNGALREVGDVEQADVVPVDRLSLLEIEAGGARVDVDDVERGDHLVKREDVAVGGESPAEKGEVVDEPLGDEAAVAVVEQVRLGVALRKLLVAVTHDVREVTEARDERRQP